MTKPITVQMLREKKACRNQVKLFQELFGDSVIPTEELCVKHAMKFGLHWFVKNFLPLSQKAYLNAVAPLRKAYKYADELLQKDYKDAEARLWKEFSNAKTQLHREYEKDLAPVLDDALAPLRKAYDDAEARSWQAYKDAVAPWRKAYEESCAKVFFKLWNEQ